MSPAHSSLSSVSPTVSDPALAQSKAEIIALAGNTAPDLTIVSGQRPTMAHMHWMMITGFETIWEAADKCQGDEVNFLAYALVVVHELEAHHAAEEAIFFPYFVSKGVQGMDHNIDDHAGMHDHIEALTSYLTSTSASDPASLDATRLRGLISSLFDELIPHLRHELGTLAPERLEGCIGPKECREIGEMFETLLKGKDPNEFLPMVIVNIKPGMGFPPLPWFVRRVLLPTMLKRKHAGLWKYGRYPREVDLW